MQNPISAQSPQRSISKIYCSTENEPEVLGESTFEGALEGKLPSKMSTMSTRAKADKDLEDLKQTVRELKDEKVDGTHMEKMMKDMTDKLMLNTNTGNLKVIESVQDSINTVNKRIEDVRVELLERMDKGEEDTNKKFVAVHETVASYVKTMKEMEEEMGRMAEDMKKMKTQHDLTAKQLAKCSDKCLDLETRSRRFNLRLVGVPEEAEGDNPREFAADLIKEALNLPNLPKIEAAHRIPRFKQKSQTGSEYTRQIIVKFRDISGVEEVMSNIKYGVPLKYEQTTFKIFRDYPYEVVQKRKLFYKVKKALQGVKGVRYGVYFPARMRISYNDQQKSFTNPESAYKYALTIVEENK